MNETSSATPRAPGVRPGGRSARVQAAVHQAVNELQASDRDGVTVPAIAARAGVTPSTIYRRWGDLAQLLADVAVSRMQPDTPPADTGAYRSDLLTWLEQYRDEMSSDPGRSLLRDILSAQGRDNPGRCASFCAQQLEAIAERASGRGEHPAPTDALLDGVVAPLIYRILFSADTPSTDDVTRWVDAVLERPGARVA
ncbi:TetR/AcrR family transcriptional regulator [Luteibacter sp. 3190]|uniref:TetR/AcrR family transcriptional regulator n=1 Tax=Luteibacter sp. 3190 TaxID=2817736 RepID=UPI00285B650D|nr:TetR/AcrR family transcriptional regulator [Luteibacter sp. 3190]MDR6935680.1 AcrR family transcriptional regulator [Luteibacter sp. 3190]